MPTDPSLAIVLAAGRGRRMGRPKLDLDLGGRTALQRCVDALRAGGVDAVVVVHDGRVAPPSVEGARLVPNHDPGRGQTSSLRAALASGLGAAGCFLIHTVDRPLVTAADVAAVLAAHRDRPAGVEIVAPSVDGRRGHPAVFCAALAAEFLALEDDEPAHVVVRRDASRVAHVVRDNPWLVRDIDTPDDLRQARAALEPDRAG